jgi:glycosyltransferase involved in cell wall biosynthesis
MATVPRRKDGKRVPTVVFAGVAIGDYRRRFLECVSQQMPQLKVITGDVHLESSFKSGQELGVQVQRVTNSFFLGRRLLWQKAVLDACTVADACVIEHNPRSLTAWAVCLRRRAGGKRTVAWGHVESREGHKRGIGLARHLQRNACGVALYYTQEERATALARYGTRPRAFVAPNALYGRSEWYRPPDCVPQDFLVIGRLSADKKPEVALQAFLTAKLPAGCKLHVVGSGPMRAALEEMARRSDRTVKFHGHVTNQEILAGLFHQSIAAISPGYVGLSIVQSTYFGCPMIYANGEPHAPEIVLADEGFNAMAVKHCTPEHFARAMERAAIVFRRPGCRFEIAAHSVERCNAEDMAAGFIAAVEFSVGKGYP